jgi:pimeloyl-ACP methyl ester carboxylesterase
VMRLKVSMDVMRPTMPWLRSPNAATSEALLAMMMADGHRPESNLVEWMSLVGQHVRTSLAPNPLPRRLLRELSHTPVDVIVGEGDAFLPVTRLRRAVHRRLPSARAVVVAGAGHMLPHERPDALLDLLLEEPGDRDQGSGRAKKS